MSEPKPLPREHHIGFYDPERTWEFARQLRAAKLADQGSENINPPGIHNASRRCKVCLALSNIKRGLRNLFRMNGGSQDG